MSLSDESKLLIAVFQQIDPFPKLDYERLRQDLGLPSVRWSRYTTKMKKLRAEYESTGALKIGGKKGMGMGMGMGKNEGKGSGMEMVVGKKRGSDDDWEEKEFAGQEEVVVGKKRMKTEEGGEGLGDKGVKTAKMAAGGRKKVSVATSLNAKTSKPGGRGKGGKAGGIGSMMAMEQDDVFGSEWQKELDGRVKAEEDAISEIFGDQ
ncbi:hypothetical protein ACMFMG_005351 [Clarireedia jacksonii]